MTYQVALLPGAARSVKKLPPEGKRRVQAMIELLATDPRPPTARKLIARPEWRVRSGDYRVLYRIEDERLTIVVVDAGHRRSVYEDRR
ncbi:type II toxin-antitoxin system RelE family toxin [Curtobacterium ammoniigenes]|uniref:type II toxin-antitoxin system RelE family toxin n=1 Tax=Curtobacterium ammoniigenes TaxID=395387 RepID=UPI00083653AC|nr:type II toxin-antitoxin system RelE/ParE family toxin [Curtobacterium ammoniigenes]